MNRCYKSNHSTLETTDTVVPLLDEEAVCTKSSDKGAYLLAALKTSENAKKHIGTKVLILIPINKGLDHFTTKERD